MPQTRVIPLCPVDEVWEGALRQAALPDGQVLALTAYDGGYYAVADTCTHGAASLSEDGSIEGPFIACSWHNGGFDVRTGEACAMPCTEPLRSWPTRIVDGQLCVEVEA